MKQFNYSRAQGCAGTRIGGRSENQDSCGFSDTPLGLLVVVCDGMGGGPGGKLASSIAVDAIIRHIMGCSPNADAEESLESAVQYAHGCLLRKIQETPELKGMGSTAAVLLINEYAAYSAHVGDSRVYQLRCGRKKFRTFDHSMVFEMVKNKAMTEERARLSYQSNIITQALGASKTVNVDVQELPYERGDRFMVCTDGIWGVMPEKDLIRMVTSPRSVAGACEGLMIQVDQMGTADGGNHDNLTAVILDITVDSILEEKMDRKTRILLLALIVLCGISLIGNMVQAIVDNSDELEKVKAENMALIKENQNYSDQMKNMLDSLKVLSRELDSQKKVQETLQSILEVNTQLLNDRENGRSDLQQVLDGFDEVLGMMESMIENPEMRTREFVDELKDKMVALQGKCKEYGVSDKEWKRKNRPLVMYLNDDVATRETSDGTSHYKILVRTVEGIRDEVTKKSIR